MPASIPNMATEIDSDWKPEFIDLNRLDGAFSFEEGFSRPDWALISKALKQKESELLDVAAAWDEVVRQWMLQLQSDLGGDYQISESSRLSLLAPLEAEKRATILDFSENTLTQIRDRLQGAAWNPIHGKYVILLFTDEDDYYQYISYYYPEGTHPKSGGCLIHKDYVHIAAPYEQRSLLQTLAHELTHNCVVHLHLPTWLNEGLATTFEHLAPNSRPLGDHELERHFAFWNEQNIQEFWAGASWHKPGDSNELSYSLAEVLLYLLSERHGHWSDFVKEADWRDAGQTAALQYLDADLGEIMGTFLGPGDWRPRRKAMVAIWEAQKRAKGKNELEPD